MKLKIIIFLLLYISIESFCESDKIDLYIGGFFPIDNVGWNGSGLVPASQMAIDDINSRDDILPNYRLNLIVGNTKASATLGVKVLFDFIHLPPKKIMLLGSGFSRVTSAIAGVAKYYNLIQTTFSSESALLSDKSEYPFLFRTCFSVNAWNIPQVTLVKHFNWTRVATLTRRSDLYDASTERLLSELYRAKVEVVAKEGFISGTNSSRQIRNLKKNDARIIIAHLQEEDAIEVFCQAYKYQMYGPNYAWIVPGFLSRTFWSKATKLEHVDCTPEEIAISANYSLSISFATMNVVTSETISGMTPNNFNIRYNNWPTIVNQTYYPNSYAAFAYDSIWAEAMAMNNSIKRLAELNRTLEDFHYGDREMSRILKEEMYNLNFSGISNIVQFDTFGDVHPHVTYLVQHQGNVKRTVATILPKEKRVDFFTTPPNVIRWAGAGPPVDRIKLKQVDIRLPLHVFIIMAALSCLAIILTIVFMIYNNKYRNARILFWNFDTKKPRNFLLISNIISGTISIISSATLCMLGPWLTTIGFATVSGSMFAKTYRAYKILTTKKRINPIHDYHLYGIVTVLILIETTVLTTWTVMDPMKPEYRILPRQTSPNNSFIILVPRLLECSCKNNIIWLATILTLNAFVLIFGAFLAYEARNIKLSVMNESKQIALCIYNVALLCIIVIPISFFLPNTSGETYIASSGLILYCTTTTTCIFFIPKIKYKHDVVYPNRRLCSVGGDKSTNTKIES